MAQHAQYKIFDPVFVQMPKDADRSLYSEDEPDEKQEKPEEGMTDKFGLRRRCLSDIVDCHLAQNFEKFDDNEKREKERARVMSILQKFLMDRMMERRGPDYYEDDKEEPDCSFFLDEVIEWNNMMAEFNRELKEKSRGPPSLLQLATSRLRRTPSLISIKMPKRVRFELIRPVFIACSLAQKIHFIKTNPCYASESNIIVREAMFREFKRAKQQLPEKYTYWYQHADNLMRNRESQRKRRVALKNEHSIKEGVDIKKNASTKNGPNERQLSSLEEMETLLSEPLIREKARGYDPRASASAPVIKSDAPFAHKVTKKNAKDINLAIKNTNTPQKPQIPLQQERFSLSPLALSESSSDSESDSDSSSDSDSDSDSPSTPQHNSSSSMTKRKNVDPIENDLAIKKPTNLIVKNTNIPQEVCMSSLNAKGNRSLELNRPSSLTLKNDVKSSSAQGYDPRASAFAPTMEHDAKPSRLAPKRKNDKPIDKAPRKLLKVDDNKSNMFTL